MDITELLTFAYKSGASDAHLTSGEPPRVRIHGDMKKLEHPPLSAEEVHDMVFDIMSDGQRKIFQETNDVDFSFELGDIARFRVNVFRERRGEGAVFRLIPTKVMTVEELGLPPILKDICDKEKGLVLVTGPTGSGKSTTLAAMIDYINESDEGHIITIEDPIEFVHQSKKCLINQREVGAHTQSFSATPCAARCARTPTSSWSARCATWRRSPLALTAAETGHLVFGTLHTSSAPKTVDRIIDVFPAAQQEQIRIMFSESIQAVVTQTLLKKQVGWPRRGAGDPDRHPRGAQPDPRGKGPPDPVRRCRPVRKSGCRPSTWRCIDLVRRNLVTAEEAQSRT